MKFNLKKLATVVAAVVVSATAMAQFSVNLGYLNDARSNTTTLGENSRTSKSSFNGFTV